MNPVQINLFLSVIPLIVAGVAMLGTQSGSETGSVPWLLIASFLAGSLVFAFFSWRKTAANAGSAEKSPKPRRNGKQG